MLKGGGGFWQAIADVQSYLSLISSSKQMNWLNCSNKKPKWTILMQVEFNEGHGYEKVITMAMTFITINLHYGGSKYGSKHTSRGQPWQKYILWKVT